MKFKNSVSYIDILENNSRILLQSEYYYKEYYYKGLLRLYYNVVMTNKLFLNLI